MSAPQEILAKYLVDGEILAGRYQLERSLGQGAYGAIYLAKDTIGYEYVAIKALPPRAENRSQTAHDRFMREMKIIHNLVHPHIVALYDFGETDNGVPYMVLEYIDGVTLDRAVHQRPMSLQSTLSVMLQIAGALGAAHSLGIIHRDLKPANIMLQGEDPKYEAKILDFGMAKLLDPIDGDSVQPLTREGVAVGTPRYIAPEQARGLEVGPYTDLYAFGLLAYEMLTGARAVKADSIEGAVRAHVSSGPLELDEWDMVPEPIRPILLKLLEKKVERRYQTAAEVSADVEELLRRQRLSARGTIPKHVDMHGKRVSAPPMLDIDYSAMEEYERDKQARSAQAPVLELNRGPSIWRPATSTIHYLERALIPALALIGFTVFTTQFSDLDPLIRGAVGAAPMLLGAFLGLVLFKRLEWFTITRGINAAAIASFGAAHVLDSKAMVANLLKSPIWFIRPIADLPIIDQLARGIVWAAHQYALFISPVLGA